MTSNIGIEIHFNNEFEKKTWIDPVDESKFDIMVASNLDLYEIDNGYNVYTYSKGEIKEFIKYNLYECCGFDARYRHSIKCENGDIQIWDGQLDLIVNGIGI
jgi:hypothetical protein